MDVSDFFSLPGSQSVVLLTDDTHDWAAAVDSARGKVQVSHGHTDSKGQALVPFTCRLLSKLQV